MRAILGASLVLALGCATSPIHEMPLSSGGRNLPDLFLGGWDGHRLHVFNDTSLEPGLSTYRDVEEALRYLSSEKYAAMYMEQKELKPEVTAAHGFFCTTEACVVVLERKGGETLKGFGKALAIIELNGTAQQPIGSVWIQEKEVRSPGPRHWPLLCRYKTDQPRHVHEDGSALFPAQTVDKVAFAVFGPQELPAQYQQAGIQAPSETTCDDDVARSQREPPAERPQIKADPNLIQKR